MPCSWQKEDYFSLLMSHDKRAHTALEMLVDDLHAEKEKTVNHFLCHSGSEDFLWGLVHLLGNDTPRVAGNAAYILGTLAESEIGCMRVISLVQHGSNESRKILPDLTRMLTFDDSESVMNAAGTMGTLAESHEGREWILSEKCLPQTLEHITNLLHSENLWTASNAALVLARLSISECGCSKVLEHEHSQHILSKLILSLGIDEAGRGMNAAFAIGRLCDMDQGRKRLLQLSDSERMISSLAKMLSCNDTGASKNACFALSCLATNSEGHSRLLGNIHSEEILKTLSVLLNAEDSETGWFAAMTLRTLASQPKGCIRLRDHPQVISSLKSVEGKAEINADLKEEAIITLEILKRLPKPSPPTINVVSSNTFKATWDPVVTKSGFQVRYQLFDGTKCVYTGKQCECEVMGLLPNTAYVYKLRAYTEGDESPFSDVVSIITEESVPGPPQDVRVLGATITQLKVGWEPPSELNGVLKGYYVFLDDKEVMYTTDLCVILTGLTANTTYEIEVCAATSKGRGERSITSGTTSEIGAHAPSKPHINVIGRNELYISWGPPEVPLGRLNRYDVIMNDKIIYSGNDLNLPIRRLVPDTEYSFVVVALTSDGKFESKMAKKRTAKDEYDQARPPLYQTPKKEPVEEGSKTPVGQPSVKRRKSSGRVSSAKEKPKRAGTAKERTKSSGGVNKEERPCSSNSVASHHTSTVVDDKPEKSEKPPDPSPPVVSQSSSSNNSPAPSSTPNSLVGKPVAEVKYEASIPRVHSSKTRNPRPLNRIERSNVSSRPQPVAISTVSMQNSSKAQSPAGKTDNAENDKKLMENDKKVVDNGKKNGKADKDLPVISSGLKIERSKTTLSGRENRRGRYTNSPNNGTLGNNLKSEIDDDRGDSVKFPLDRVKPIPNDRETSGVNSRRSRLSEDSIISGSRDKVSKEHRERSGRGHATRSSKGSKDANLPKPAPPSQKYLEGSVQGEMPWGHKTAPSPRSSKDGAFLDSDWLTQVKSVSESYTRPFAHTNAISNSADSTYFIDPSQFLQRTNTYIASHRRRFLEPLPELDYPTHPVIYEEPMIVPPLELEPWSERKSSGSALNRCFSSKERTSQLKSQHIKFTSQLKLFPRVDHVGIDRPIGRKSLERLQKTTQGLKVPMPSKLGPSTNFDFDIPENTTSKLANKFIPMQLRTQPSNLGMGQLQRVNTTLMGELTGDNSVSFRRVEAMTRSHTQLDIKQQTQLDVKQSHLSSLDYKPQGQGQIPMENRRDLGFLTSKDKERSIKKASSTGKVHKLGSSAGGSHQRNKEPDSMYLQQSWSLNNSSDLGALQNVR